MFGALSPEKIVYRLIQGVHGLRGISNQAIEQRDGVVIFPGWLLGKIQKYVKGTIQGSGKKNKVGPRRSRSKIFFQGEHSLLSRRTSDLVLIITRREGAQDPLYSPLRHVVSSSNIKKVYREFREITLLGNASFPCTPPTPPFSELRNVGEG